MTRRLRLAGISWLYTLLFPVAIVLFVLSAVFIPLVLVGVGAAMLLAIAPLVRLYAGAERALAGWVLGRRIESGYRVGPRGPLRALRRWATDPQRWKDLLVLPVAFTIGFVLTMLANGLLLGTVFYLLYPWLYAVTPKNVFGTPFGFWHLHSVAESFGLWVVAAIAFGLWWVFSPPLLSARAHLARAVLSPSRSALERRVREVAQSRAETVDYSAAELRRIERDLHDGAQARLVSLGMSLGLAEDLMHRDPAAAARLLLEARQMTTSALGDIRTVVRGIHPPVLADRGLVAAVEALALDVAVPVTVRAELAGRAPLPVESAVYFAVAECLANIVKHSQADAAGVTMGYRIDRLVITVQDDGRGGADPGRGTGLAGLGRRVGAFDGTVQVHSPPGGPTVVTLEVPCALTVDVRQR